MHGPGFIVNDSFVHVFPKRTKNLKIFKQLALPLKRLLFDKQSNSYWILLASSPIHVTPTFNNAINSDGQNEEHTLTMRKTNNLLLL